MLRPTLVHLKTAGLDVFFDHPRQSALSRSIISNLRRDYRLDQEEYVMSEKTSIVVNTNGPLRVTGDFVIKAPQGQEFDLAGRSAISLCRCGLSENKPFCDGRHGAGAFESRVEACKLPPPATKG